MLYIRGNRRDFDQWESFGNPGWGYDDVLPYFKKSEDQRNPYLARNTKYHSTDSPYNTSLDLSYLEATEEMACNMLDINAERQTGFAFFQYIKQKKSYGAEYIRNVEVIFAKREVILSVGAINTPQLLMLSGIGVRNHLENDRYSSDPGFTWCRTESSRSYRRSLASSTRLEVVGFLSSKYANQTDDWSDMKFMITSATINNLSDVKVNAFCLTNDFYDQAYSEIINHDSFSIISMILRPKSRKYMKLNSKNLLNYPLMYHDYLMNPDDMNVLRRVKTTIAFAETSSLKKLGARFYSKPLLNCKHLTMFIDEYWECAICQFTVTIYHIIVQFF
ncbi:hypothetical protein HZH68_004114 [Vespula germanica]|uniref:Glucose-methanol-choline oxidoreductase N-terminal domain-containing protein n=1 Tax=Vespula germanica TaxID=30212 RepID=A0A834KN57_VESGE|nr:hypothetical protein HZH68_004114 [Vespula germanica]